MPRVRVRSRAARRRRRRVTVLGLVVLVGTALTAFRTCGPAAADRADHEAPADATGVRARAFAMGVLGGSCDAARVTALRRAGVQLVEVGAEWSRFEPAPGRVDQGYVDDLRARVARCEDAGLGVVLTLGLHLAPAWVVDLPDGAYVDQHGTANPTGVPNYVFSAAARATAAHYVDRLAAALPLDRLAAVRVGTGEAGELGYPGREFGTGDNRLWAFDGAAQTGDGLAAGMSPTPMPGWVPGARSWRGRDVATAQVRSWFDWYADAVARTVVWQIDLLRAQGYRGPVHVPLAGRGVLPADLAAATKAALAGPDPDGSIEKGLFYPDQLQTIAAATREDPRADPGTVVVDATGVDDGSAVVARGLSPPQDTCTPDDAGLPLREVGADGPAVAVDAWSSTRWTVANARAAGLRVIGENPGHPAAPGTGGDPTSDDLAAQLRHAPQYAKDCGLEALLWAFEDDLFSPNPEVSLDDLAERIAE